MPELFPLSPVHYVAAPLLAAFLLPLVAKLSRSFIKILPGLTFLYVLYVSAVLFPHALQSPIIEQIAGWAPPLGINLYYGPMAGLFASLFSALGFIVWLYSLTQMKQEPLDRFYILLMMLVAGATGIVLTGDIFNLFVFMEITAISAFSLTAFLREDDKAEAGFKYILIGSLASTFVLLGIAVLYSYTGTLNLADLALSMEKVPLSVRVIVFGLFLVGFGIEAEIFPLNGWAPDAYSAAPAPVSALFAGITVKAALYALARVTILLFPFAGSMALISILGLVTLVISELAALHQKNLFRMLAYSSMGQVGLAIAALGLFTAEGVYAALFAMINHAIVKGMLFLAVFAMAGGSANLDNLNGMGRKKPVLSFMFTLGAFAIIGLPPFSGFWSKLSVLTAMGQTGNYIMIAIVLATTIVEATYYLRATGRLYLSEGSPVESKTPLSAIAAVAVLAAGILWIGFFPGSIDEILTAGAQDLLDTAKYTEGVLKD